MGTLGISLGTTSSGIAIINGKELILENIHSFRAPWTAQKADYIVKRLLKYLVHYHIQLVVIKLPPRSHQPETVRALIAKLTEQCSYHGCIVKTCTKSELKRHIIGARNTADMMRFVASQYPSLTQKHEQAQKHKNQYHTKVFEAVLAAHIQNTKSG
jgi:RNase H-fold protein (predicted Holliday junction resolvase)